MAWRPVCSWKARSFSTGVSSGGCSTPSRPFLPNSAQTGEAACAARNSPRGSDQRSSLPVFSSSGRGAISATSMCASTGSAFQFLL